MSNLKKSILLLMAVLCFLITLSCAFASEINTDSISDSNGVSLISASPLDEINLGQSEAALSDFDELKIIFENLNTNGYYKLDKDYYLGAPEDNSSVRVINIAGNNIGIDGNGHTIDGENFETVFNVTGKFVYITNLRFTNFNNAFTSPVMWYGATGAIFNCVFDENLGYNGAAINWQGYNGYMHDCNFKDNVALNRGGALFLSSDNIDVGHCVFRNSTGSGNEAIYVENGVNENNEVRIFCCDFEGSAADNIGWDDGCELFIDRVAVNFKTFEDVRRDLETLNPGDIYNIEKNYVISDPSEELRRNRIINIKADNVIINGNGHIIDAKGSENFFALFNVTGNNVTIMNLGITNSLATNNEYIIYGHNIYGDNYSILTSPVEWHGNNGVISNCTFTDNSGETGGAICWFGDNGIIDNCVFDDNGADFGGAIYILGANNSIVNSEFINSYTYFHYEAIYLANNALLSLENCNFKSPYKGAKAVEVENGAKIIYVGGYPVLNFPASDFTELAYYLSNLKDNEVFNIESDFELRSFDKFPVINANNVTINGNGHKIFGGQPAYNVLYVNGSNVAINDLTFEFAYELLKGDSYISWNGDNGELNNCLFGGNSYNGETITWKGNNAVIDNCVFADNPDKSAAAIYMEGTENIISNTAFASTNAVSGIYYTNKNKGGSLALVNCSAEEMDEIWIGDDSDVTLNGYVIPKTFADLCTDISTINEGETYKLYRDYYITQADERCAINNKNIVINGGNHVFDGNGLSAFVSVVGDGIAMNNVNFNNFNNEKGESLITWSGDNGVFADCGFEGNAALNGGAITWNGNNGLIDSCEFVDNLARGVGGAIYLGGFNNLVSNSLFSNSVSKLTGEAVYLAGEGNNYTFSNVTFTESDTYIIDGYYNGIDISYLNNSVISSMCGVEFDLIPLVYSTITKEKTHQITEDMYCYSSYDEFGDGSMLYTFNVVKMFFVDGITYEVCYNFFNKNITQVFDSILSGDYYYTANIVKNINFGYNVRDYELASQYSTVNLYVDNMDALEVICDDLERYSDALNDVAIALNVSFAPGSYFTSNAAWSNNGFGVVYINGHGSTVKSTSDEDDEYTFFENSAILSIVDLNIEQFNHGIVNYGTCILRNVNFKGNHILYAVAPKDWGAAILNVGTCVCENCNFDENIARCGGAIFNQGALTLENCKFHGNEVKSSFWNDIGLTTGGVGIDVCNVNGKGSVELIGSNADISNVDDLDATDEALLIMSFTALSFLAGVGIGYATHSSIIGFALGMLAGGVIGAIGSITICYNKMDATYDCLRLTLCLIGGSMVAGAIGGIMGGVISTSSAVVVENDAANAVTLGGRLLWA